MRISNDKISVIVQGPIDWSMDERYLTATTSALCARLREILPSAEIILSTWNGQVYAGLDIDRVVLNDDPGPQGNWPSFVPTNINRQIVSTVAGLQASVRPYCLKCRTDVVIEGTEFLERYAALPPIPADKRRLFDHPIVSNNLTSRNTTEILSRLPDHPLLFHPSDHVHFGLRSDLLNLWDIDLQSEDDAFYFLDRAQPNRWRYHELGKLTPEQFLLINAIGKKVSIEFPHFAYYSPEVAELSEYYLHTHFSFLPDRIFPIHFSKYHTPHHFSFEWMRINPDPNALEQPKVQHSWRWKLTYPFRNPAGFRRWLKKALVASTRRVYNRLAI